MQDKAQTRSRTAAAIAVVFAATALTVALIGLFGRASGMEAGAREGTRNAGVEVTDGWQYNEILNPPRGSGAEVTDGWQYNEVLNPPRGTGVDLTDGWQYNEVLNPPRGTGVEFTDGWMYNEFLNPPSDEITHHSPGR